MRCKCQFDTFCLSCKIAGELAQQVSTRCVSETIEERHNLYGNLYVDLVAIRIDGGK